MCKESFCVFSLINCHCFQKANITFLYEISE